MKKKFLIPLGISVIFGVGAAAFADDGPMSGGDVPKPDENSVGVPVLRPDLSVFEQLTDMQRKVTVMEKEILLEDLKFKRQEIDARARELVEKEQDRQEERQALKEQKIKDEAEAALKKERDAVIKHAEEDLRLAELRAQQEFLLRSIEEQAKKDEDKKAEQAKAEQAKAEQEIILAREQARRSVRGAKQEDQPLIVTPTRDQNPVGDNLDAQLASLAPLISGAPTGPGQSVNSMNEPVAQAEVPPPPPPNPVVRSVKGVGGQLLAQIILPEGGMVDVVEGDRIPGDWKIVKIDPDGVFVKKAKDKKTTRLSFGTKVNVPVEENPEKNDKPPATGFSIPLASNNFPIPSGLPGPAMQAPGGLAGLR